MNGGKTRFVLSWFHHLQPELGPFGLRDPQAQHFFHSRNRDPDGQHSLDFRRALHLSRESSQIEEIRSVRLCHRRFGLKIWK